MSAFRIAGMFSGIGGMLAFLIIHHIWIQPIWFILPLGFVIAGVGGIAVGWAYQELLPNLPPRPWTTLAVIALIVVILLPSIVLAELRESMFDITVPGGLLVISTAKAVEIFILELLGTATLMGALAGWMIGHNRRAALATALAGFIFALGPGHNIPLLGSTPGVWKGIFLLSASVIVSAIVLVETHHILSQRSLNHEQFHSRPQP